jgi:neutral ceramidase
MIDETMVHVGRASRRWRLGRGLPMDGYRGRSAPSDGTLDPLFVRALTVEHAGAQLVIVTIDVVGVDATVVARIREILEARRGVPPDHVMVTATHTHGGPAGIRRFGNVGPSPELCDALVPLVIETVGHAVAGMAPAHIWHGAGHVPWIAQNRRDPDRPAAPRLDVIHFEGPDGRTRAVLVGFACHPTVLDHRNTSFSADYPGAVVRTVGRALGRPADVLFVTGACADINPARAEATSTEVDRIGLAIGAEAIRIIAERKAAAKRLRADNTRWLEQTPAPAPEVHPLRPRLRGVRVPLLVPLKAFASGSAYWHALRDLEHRAQGPLPLAERRDLFARLTHLRAEASSAELARRDLALGVTRIGSELQIIRLSHDVAVLAVPGELFHSIGSDAGRQWPGELIVVGYANDYIGYLNTDASYAEGGYEAGRTFTRPGTEAVLQRSVAALLARLREDTPSA